MVISSNDHIMIKSFCITVRFNQNKTLVSNDFVLSYLLKILLRIMIL